MNRLLLSTPVVSLTCTFSNSIEQIVSAITKFIISVFEKDLVAEGRKEAQRTQRISQWLSVSSLLPSVTEILKYEE